MSLLVERVVRETLRIVALNQIVAVLQLLETDETHKFHLVWPDDLTIQMLSSEG